MLYQPFVVYPANGNPIAHPWGMTTLSPRMVNVGSREINLEQVLQIFAPMVIKTPNDNEDEYRGPTLHSRLPPRAAQHTVQNLNQGVQIHPPRPGASFVVAPPFVFLGAPYAPYQNQCGPTIGQMVNPGLMYPRGYPPFASPPVISQATPQGIQLPNR